MATVAAIHWWNTTSQAGMQRTLNMCIIDDDTGIVQERLRTFPINTPADVKAAMAAFSKMLKQRETSSNKKILYKIEHATNYVQARRGTPEYLSHKLTTAVNNQFHALMTSTVGAPWWIKNKQKRSLLSGTSLRVFKNGLTGVALVSHAWEWHLWSVSLDATATSCEKRLKVVWQQNQGIIGRRLSAAQRQQFDAWYAAL